MSYTTRSQMRVTWMDGKQETYPFTHQATSDGELHLWTENGNPGITTWTSDELWIPLANVRVRVVSR